MKLKTKKYGNSVVIVLPKEYRDLEYLWVYPVQQLRDSEKLDYIYTSVLDNIDIPKNPLGLKCQSKIRDLEW